MLLAVTPFPSARADAAIDFFFAYFSKNRPRTEKSLETLTGGYLADTFLDPEFFSVFFIFQPPQHKPHVELRDPQSEHRILEFSSFTGRRDAGSGSRGLRLWG